MSADTGLGTLKSTLPRDSTLRQAPSSSLSFTNPQSQFHSNTVKEDLNVPICMETMDVQGMEDEKIKSPIRTIRFQFKGATVVVYPNADAESEYTEL